MFRHVAALSMMFAVAILVVVGVVIKTPQNLTILTTTVGASDEDLTSTFLYNSAHLARKTLARSLRPQSSSLLTATSTEVDETEKSQSPTNDHIDLNSIETNSIDQPGENNQDDKNIAYDGTDLIEWINTNGGFIHENARIGLDPMGMYRGVFVKNRQENNLREEGIEEGDIIARIPWELIIKPKNYATNIYWSCEAIHELYHQFQLGDKSKYAPYVNYLKNQPGGRIPSDWTTAGKQLLNTILDRSSTDETIQKEEEEEEEEEEENVNINDNDDKESDDRNNNGLPPKKFLKGYEETWIQECDGEDTPLARAAFYQFTSRDEDTLMVPFYDMHNHSNDPKKLNTISYKPKGKGRPFVLRALRDIHPGEQIYISYNRCHRCWFDEDYKDCVSYSHYGTSEVFDIFGFVEDYPQSWMFPMKIDGEDNGRPYWDELKFCLERSEDSSDDNYDERLIVTFGDNYISNGEEPSEANIKYLAQQLLRLDEVEQSLKHDKLLMEIIPSHEWDMAWNYHRALMISISAAMLASDLLPNDNDSEDDDSGEKERIVPSMDEL